MFSGKTITKENFDDLFEEQKAVFAEGVAAGEKYLVRSEYYVIGNKVATLYFPRFESEEHVRRCFQQASHFPKVVNADESIIYLDTQTQTTNSKTSEVVDSDAFIAIRTTHRYIYHLAAPYYMNPEVRYPVWNTDLTVNADQIFNLRDLISTLNFAITKLDTVLVTDVLINYLEANGFHVEFHHPFTKEIICKFIQERN